MPLLHVTTRIEDRPHDDLLSDKADRVLFPTVIFMDGQGEPLAVVPDLQTVAKYDALLGTVRRYLELRKRRDAGDETVATDFAIAACELGQVDFDELEADLEGVKLSEEQKARVAQLRVNAAVRIRFLITRKQRNSEESLKAATEEFLKLLKDGPEPDLGGDEERMFWHLVWRHGHGAGDVAAMERALKGMRRLAADSDSARAREFLERLEKELEAAKEAK